VSPSPQDAPVHAGLPPALDEPQLDHGIAATNGHTDGEDDALSALQALKELGELHAAGVLTDAEFAVKKAELLRRV
jgi:Short C-terminal domain